MKALNKNMAKYFVKLARCKLILENKAPFNRNS